MLHILAIVQARKPQLSVLDKLSYQQKAVTQSYGFLSYM